MSNPTCHRCGREREADELDPVTHWCGVCCHHEATDDLAWRLDLAVAIIQVCALDAVPPDLRQQLLQRAIPVLKSGVSPL